MRTTTRQWLGGGEPREKRLLVGLAVIFLLVGCASGPTASPSSSTSTAMPAPVSNPAGQMTVGRGNHTATPLADGRVLVAGGFGTGLVPLASAEIYDPTTATFSPTGSMASARDHVTAVPLSDGRVLVIGSVSGAPPSAELYDPKTGTFTATGSMTEGRGPGYKATLLADGRVLVTGGKTATTLASAELYDPKTGTFSPTGSMATARLEHTATLLADGRVLVAGGQGHPAEGASTALVSAELYDPKSGTFGPTGPLTTARVLQTATPLADGRVLVTGGLQTLVVGEGFPLASAELYDPTSGTFSPTGSMATARVGYTATLLADGRILVAGGTNLPNTESASGVMLASAELYHPQAGTFIPTGDMTTARAGHTATPLADNRVLVTGGVEALTATGPGPSVASAELYDPKTGTFSATGP